MSCRSNPAVRLFIRYETGKAVRGISLIKHPAARSRRHGQFSGEDTRRQPLIGCQERISGILGAAAGASTKPLKPAHRDEYKTESKFIGFLLKQERP
jgi:hypothetical protein